MIEVSTDTCTYRFDPSAYTRGDVFDVYRGESRLLADGNVVSAAIKLGRSPDDQLPLEHEQAVLGEFWDYIRAHPDFEFFGHTLPKPLGVFTYDSGTEQLPGAALKWSEGYTTKRIREAFPTGIDPVQVAWMLTRLLTTIAASHRRGWIHGAVLPSNLLVRWDNAKGHRYAKMLDWTAAVRPGEPLRRIFPQDVLFYPPEAFSNEPATERTDIYMFGQTANYLLGGDLETRKVPTTVPAPIRGVIQMCLIPNPARRPTSASRLLLDELRPAFVKVWGEPKYTSLELPSGA